MKEILDYIKDLEEGSFEGWSEDEKNAYLTACTSIKKKIEEKQPKKTSTFYVNHYKDYGWHELAHDLAWEDFKKQHSDLDEDELADKFYKEVVEIFFQYGEYGSFEIEVDENFNIVGGMIYRK